MSSAVPEGWQVSQLGSLATVNWGNTSLTKDSYAETGFPAYSAAGNDGLVPNAEHNDVGVVLSAIGARCGRTFLTPKRWTAIKNTITVLSDNQDIRFLYQVFNFNEVWNKSGGAQPFISLGDARKTPILTPPLPEQKKIASILTSVDEVIENTQKKIDKLQDLKKATMNELLTKGIGHTEFKDSELGRIPKSWEVKTIGELGSLKNGLNKSKESFGYGTKFVNISDAYPVQLNCDSLGRLDASSKEIEDYSLEGGDLVFVRSSVKLGGVAIPTEFCSYEEPVVFCGFMIRFRPFLKGLESSFLRQYLLNDATRIRIERLATGGANININQEALSQFKVLLPTVEEQKYFSSINVGFEYSLQKYQEKLSQTKSLKKSLMQDLLTGKVRVTVD